MQTPLIIGGREIIPELTQTPSPFYEGYCAQTANARLTDVAAAIGCARSADPGDLETRRKALRIAAQSFSFDDHDLEHAVRMMGTPIQVVKRLFEDIPRWLRETPRLQEGRFVADHPYPIADQEAIGGGIDRVFQPARGFCYAVTPGNDPRASALVAANLGYLGVPFVLRASRRDAVAPLVIKALLQGGFDPDFCSLLYFDNQGASQKNTKLVEGSSIVWTFGPRRLVDGKLRYRPAGRRLVIPLPEGVEDPQESDIPELAASQGFTVETAQDDLFEDKIVLRHESGNCAAILQGGLDEKARQALARSILFPLGCTDVKSIFLVAPEKDWLAKMEAFLQGLKVGDPLDGDTHVGYVNPRNLDALEKLTDENRLRVDVVGGERISACQAHPLLVASQDEAPDFFGQEIPAYVLAARVCEDVEQASDWINRYTGDEPRLAVSLLNLPEAAGRRVLSELRAHAVMIDRATAEVAPILHEGNDYAFRLRRGKLILGDWE